MTADILILPIFRKECEARSAEQPFLVRLSPRTAQRLRTRARDCRVAPDELAAMLLDEILNPRRRS